MEDRHKVIKEFPDYMVSSCGKFFSNHSKKRKEIKQYLDKDGYPFVRLCVNGKINRRIAHRIVAKTFIKNPYNKPQVNHKNGIRNDNRVENLEWLTISENVLYSYRVLNRKHTKKMIERSRISFTGTNNPKAKINYDIANQIRQEKKDGVYYKDICTKYGISKAQMYQICRNKYWKNPELIKEK